jgi:choline kinase
MRYVKMANGKGIRWGNHGGVPKQLIKIGGENLLERTVRLVKKLDKGAEIIISSSNPSCEVAGIRRHAPINGDLEIDRFTYELIQDGICFLYGDTYYTEDALKRIIETKSAELLFFGSEKGIIAVKSGNSATMKTHIDRIKNLFLSGEIDNCKGWQLYQSYINQPFGDIVISESFVRIEDVSGDFNTPEDLERFKNKLGEAQGEEGDPK